MLLRIGISNGLLLKDVVTHVVAKSENARVARPLLCEDSWLACYSSCFSIEDFAKFAPQLSTCRH